MRRILLALAAILCLATSCAAIQMNLQSAYDLSVNTETELADLQTSIVVVSTTEQYFMLVNLVLHNQSSSTAQIIIRLHETTTAIPDVSDTITVPSGTSTIQLPTFTDGASLGLGSHTFEVYVTKVTSAHVIFQTGSYLGIFSSTVPGGVIISLNGQTDAVQTFSRDEDCPFFTIGSIGGVHEFCLPNSSDAGVDSLAFGQAADASGDGSAAYGPAAIASADRDTAVGTGAVAGFDDSVAVGYSAIISGVNGIAIGSGASADAGGIAIGKGAAAAAATAVLGGDTQITEVVVGADDASATGPFSAVTIRPPYPSGTNKNGAALHIQPGQGTGNANSANIVLDKCPSGSSGATPNTCTAAWTMSGDTGNIIPLNNETIGGLFTPMGAVTTQDMTIQETTSEPTFSATQTVAAATTILASATQINLNCSGNVILTSTPTIANGADGQRITIFNTDSTDMITLQDRGTLANSNLRLRDGQNRQLSAGGGNITLRFNSILADWVEDGTSVATVTPTSTQTSTATVTPTVTPTP